MTPDLPPDLPQTFPKEPGSPAGCSEVWTRRKREEEKLSPTEFEALWLEEAERRLEEWEQGKVEGIPGDKVMKEFRDLLA